MVETLDLTTLLMDNFWMTFAIVIAIITITIFLISLSEYYNKIEEIKEERRLEDEKRARLEAERRRLEANIKVQLEREQQARGLVKFVEEKWGKAEEVERWKQELFEMQQRAKGLVKFKGEWVTPREKFDREQKARGLVKFVDRHGKESWSTPKQVQEWKRIDIGLQSNFSELNTREFEEFIADLFRRMGYNVQLLTHGSDYGGGVLAQKNSDKILVQCKKLREEYNAGNQDVQKTLASMWKYKANKSVLITTSDFTAQAHEQAKDTPIELWNKDILHKVVEKYYLSGHVGVEARKEPVVLDEKTEALKEEVEKQFGLEDMSAHVEVTGDTVTITGRNLPPNEFYRIKVGDLDLTPQNNVTDEEGGFKATLKMTPEHIKKLIEEGLNVEAKVNFTQCQKCGKITPFDLLESSASGLPQCPSCGSEIPLTEKKKSTFVSGKNIRQGLPTGET